MRASSTKCHEGGSFLIRASYGYLEGVLASNPVTRTSVVITILLYDIVVRYCKKRGSEWEGERWNYSTMIPEQLKCGGKRNRDSILQASVIRLTYDISSSTVTSESSSLSMMCICVTLCVFLLPYPPSSSFTWLAINRCIPHFGLVLLWVSSC